jgi:hypothetical protein
MTRSSSPNSHHLPEPAPAMLDFGFTCTCGQAAVAPKLAENDWAILAGYGDASAVRLYETEELARTNNEFKSLEGRPRIGDTPWLALTFPFASARGDSFWCIHEPPSFFYAGVDNDDTEIRQFSFVRCRDLTDLAITQQDVAKEGGFWLTRKAGIARATVEAVITVDDLLQLPLSEAKPDDRLWMYNQFAGSTMIFRQGSLVYVHCTTNVDWRFWSILHDTPEATDLLAFCDSSEHDDVVRIGRTRLRHGAEMIGPGVPPEWLATDSNPFFIQRSN